jgi:myosin heavy subunit
MKLSGELLRLGNLTRSVRAREKTTHDAEMQAQIKRQADEIEDLKQKVKQSKQELTQDIKVIEKQPDKVEDIKEKRAHFLDAVELKRQVDELQQEVQQLKKLKVSIKPHSVDKPKEEVTASSSSNNQPPPPPPAPEVVQIRMRPRRRKPASPEQAEPAEPAHVRSSSTDTSFYPEAESDQPRGRKRNPSKPKHVTISELKESLPEVKRLNQRQRRRANPRPVAEQDPASA